MGIEKVEVKQNQTVRELVDELKLSFPFLLEVNGEIIYPDMNYGKVLKRGDIVAVIPILAGG